MYDENLPGVLNDPRVDKAYQVTKAKIEFASAMRDFMTSRNINNSQLANKLGKSRSWVTRVLSGQRNFSISTMVDLADAVGGKLILSVSKQNSSPSWPGVNYCNAASWRTNSGDLKESASNEPAQFES